MNYLFGFCYYLIKTSATSLWSKDCAQGDVRNLTGTMTRNAIFSCVKKDTYKELIWKKKTVYAQPYAGEELLKLNRARKTLPIKTL